MSKAPTSTTNAPEISIVMKDTGEKITGWSGFQIVNAIDAAANGFGFSVPFDPTPANIARFRPYSPGVVKIFLGDEQFLLGYFEKITATSSSAGRLLTIEGRSASGGIVEWSAGSLWDQTNQVFRDETAFDVSGMTAGDIAKYLAAAHKIFFQPDTGVINDLLIEPGQTLFQIIGKLAAANGYFGVPQYDESLIYRNDLGETDPVAELIEGQTPLVSVETTHDVTKRHWRYRAIGSATGNSNSWAISTDSELAPAIRGIKIVQPEQQSTEIQKAADMARSRGLIDSYSLTATVKGFAYNLSGGEWRFWRAGDVIDLYAPGAFILKERPFIIKRATFTEDVNNGQQTVLDLAFPELYSGGFPKEFPWVA